MNLTDTRNQRNLTKKSKKRSHIKNRRKARRKPQIQLQKLQVNSLKKLGLLVPGKESSHINARKSPGKSLSKSLLCAQKQKVTQIPSQMMHQAVLRKETLRKPKRKRRKKVHIPVINNEMQERTNRRTNWKVATDERSEESSEDD